MPESLDELIDGLSAFCLPQNATVKDAIQCLRQNGHGFAVVVDASQQVVGTVLDATVRRAVLRGISREARIDQVISERPVLAEPAMTERALIDLLHSHRLRCVPVVDDHRQLQALHCLRGTRDDLLAPKAMIMAGGRGLRLRPVTDKVPKPLLKVGTRSIVERIISGLALAGMKEIFLAVNYKAEIFEERLGTGEAMGVAIRYVREECPMGTAGALTLLPLSEQGPILVSNGDIVTTIDFRRLLEFHWRYGGAITIAAVEYLSHIPYGVLRNVEHHVLSIDEKPMRQDFCSAGIYVIEPHVLRLFEKQTYLDMPDMIAAVIAEGLPVHVFPILEKWFDIGGSPEFERVLIDFATGDEE